MMDNNPTNPPIIQTIDWSEIHQRVETARQALLQENDSTPEQDRLKLKSRARLLAREVQQTDTNQEFLEIVAFQLASETYGIESVYVREVYPLKDFTPLPGLPPFVLGIVNVRGQILSVIDLKIFFNLPTNGLGQLNKLIILRGGQMEFGILADDILGALSIPLAAIQPAPPTASGIGAEYLRGVTIERLILLDAEKILNDERIIVQQEAN
jgi:purine-binding chemotaxis protein CheW